MAFITWNDELSVQISSIDEQHKKLINMINALNDALAKGKAQMVAVKIFDGLVQYTEKHFRFEEELFRAHGYPDEPNHRKQHDELRAQIMDLKKKMDAGEAMIGVELMAFLKGWLTKHIMKTDKGYSSFFMQKGIQ